MTELVPKILRYPGVLCARICLGFLLFAGLSGTSSASPEAESWIELSVACESVISTQSFEPLEDYEPAPLNSGKPGMKEYSVYNMSRDLVAIARVLQEKDWVTCYVRESEEDRSHTQSYAADWRQWMATAYPKAEYLWGSNLNSGMVNPFAIRCFQEEFGWLTYASLEEDFHFRVVVTKKLPRGMSNPCKDRGSG